MVNLGLEVHGGVFRGQRESLGDGLGQDLLQSVPTGAAGLEGVGRDLDCQGPGLTGGVALLGGDGDLDWHQAVGVVDDDMRGGPSPPSPSSSSHPTSESLTLCLSPGVRPEYWSSLADWYCVHSCLNKPAELCYRDRLASTICHCNKPSREMLKL